MYLGSRTIPLTPDRGWSGGCSLLLSATGLSAPSQHALQDFVLRGRQSQSPERAPGERMKRVADGKGERHSVGDRVMCDQNERGIPPALDKDGAGERRLAWIEWRRQLLADFYLPARARIVVLDDPERNGRVLFAAKLRHALWCPVDANAKERVPRLDAVERLTPGSRARVALDLRDHGKMDGMALVH
ncbi:MAG TPA: hypothetical protein VI075_00805 [Methyloceanibacter sp.]